MHLAVGEGVQEHCSRRLPVAAGATDLLVVLFDGSGEGSVDYCSDIGFVDAHAEGDRGDHDFEVSGEEVALDALACAGVKASVVGCGAAA